MTRRHETNPPAPGKNAKSKSRFTRCVLSLLLCVGVMFACAPSGVVSGQTSAAPSSIKKTPVKKTRRANSKRAGARRTPVKRAAAKETNTVRDRRVSADGAPASDSVTSKDAAPATVAEPSAGDAAAEAMPMDAAAASAETREMMRAEIDAAKSDAERGQLERRFVAHLAENASREESVDEFRRLIAGTRFDPPLYYNVGNQLARLGDYTAAAEAYRKAIAQRQGNYPRALNNLGVVLMRLGNPAEAEESFIAALKQENDSYAEAHFNVARLYRERGDDELALRHLRRAVKLDRTHAPAAIMLAEMLVARGDREEALKVLTNVRTLDDDARRSIVNTRDAINLANPSDAPRAKNAKRSSEEK